MKRIKSFAWVAVVGFLMMTACKHKVSYDPNEYLSKQEQDSILYKIVRYSAKLPPRSTHETKFDHEFDPYYKKVVANYRFLHLVKNEDASMSFLIEMPAKSITTAFESIGGKLKLDEKDSLIEYEEVFRTWKMPYRELTERGLLLFDRMVTNRDLTIYYPKYTGDKYIEFPDGRFSFDKQSRRWVDNVLPDSLEIEQ